MQTALSREMFLADASRLRVWHLRPVIPSRGIFSWWMIPSCGEKVADVAFSGIYSMNAFAKAAPVLAVIERDKSVLLARLGGQVRDVKYSLVDIGIAIEHFVLQAAEEGGYLLDRVV